MAHRRDCVKAADPARRRIGLTPHVTIQFHRSAPPMGAFGSTRAAPALARTSEHEPGNDRPSEGGPSSRIRQSRSSGTDPVHTNAFRRRRSRCSWAAKRMRRVSSAAPPVPFRRLQSRRGQNIASGFTSCPVPPGITCGATTSMNSQRFWRAASSDSGPSSGESSSGMPIEASTNRWSAERRPST